MQLCDKYAIFLLEKRNVSLTCVRYMLNSCREAFALAVIFLLPHLHIGKDVSLWVFSLFNVICSVIVILSMY